MSHIPALPFCHVVRCFLIPPLLFQPTQGLEDHLSHGLSPDLFLAFGHRLVLHLDPVAFDPFLFAGVTCCLLLQVEEQLVWLKEEDFP